MLTPALRGPGAPCLSVCTGLTSRAGGGHTPSHLPFYGTGTVSLLCPSVTGASCWSLMQQVPVLMLISPSQTHCQLRAVGILKGNVSLKQSLRKGYRLKCSSVLYISDSQSGSWPGVAGVNRNQRRQRREKELSWLSLLWGYLASLICVNLVSHSIKAPGAKAKSHVYL